jgi:hypothetical protein
MLCAERDAVAAFVDAQMAQTFDEGGAKGMLLVNLVRDSRKLQMLSRWTPQPYGCCACCRE